jgi:tetratricopeptide (TPR) repeat protein
VAALITRDAAPAPRVADADRLLALALSRPREALAEAEGLLSASASADVASLARQVRAIVWRDEGRTREALRELRHAARLAARTGDADRMADVAATLGLTLGLAGRGAEGLRTIGRAVAGTGGVGRGRALLRRAVLLRVLGRYDDALADLRAAIRLLQNGGDRIWQARAHTHRFLVYAALGQAARADRDLAVAEEIFDAEGQDLESAMVVHNRADVALQAGDLPGALGHLDDAAARYAKLGPIPAPLAIDRCAVLLAAGLPGEAVTATEEALRRHVERGGEATTTGELHLAVAQGALAGGRYAAAAEHAAAARAMFRRQDRPVWQARASFVALQARHATAGLDRRHSAEAGAVADRLEEHRVLEAPAAHLFAGRLAAARGWTDRADHHLARAAQYRHRGPTFGRAAGWLAHALRADARGDTAATLIACRRGLIAAGQHLRALAAPELRAHAAWYGTELAALAQRHAVARADARMLWSWSERWRAAAMALPHAQPPVDRELSADLASLRSVVRDLSAGGDAAELTARRHRLEDAIRARTRRTVARHGTGEDGAAGEPGDLTPVLDELGDDRLIELVVVDDFLYAVTVAHHRARMHRVGPVAAALREVHFGRFALRRLAYGRATGPALRQLDEAGARLERALLGDAAAELGDGLVVVVAPARLHAVPWATLPALRRAPFVVAPSAALWLRARRMAPPRHRRVAVVLGPGLPAAAGEISAVAGRYPDALMLSGGAATAEATLAALDGAWTAHIAAHGVFRGDNPLFSALSLDDGPLTVYDLARLRRSPYRLVLSSCESGVAAQIGGDDLLGMVTALAPLGTASMLASVVQVNDGAMTSVMVDFHDALRRARSFPRALREVRERAGDDPVAVATALSFVALGA